MTCSWYASWYAGSSRSCTCLHQAGKEPDILSAPAAGPATAAAAANAHDAAIVDSSHCCCAIKWGKWGSTRPVAAAVTVIKNRLLIQCAQSANIITSWSNECILRGTLQLDSSTTHGAPGTAGTQQKEVVQVGCVAVLAACPSTEAAATAAAMTAAMTAMAAVHGVAVAAAVAGDEMPPAVWVRDTVLHPASHSLPPVGISSSTSLPHLRSFEEFGTFINN
jgi:hypothetical protein